VLPMVLVLIIFGGQVMHLWMGSDYGNAVVPAILAVGFLGAAIQTPILSMLEGLNSHGRAGVGQFVGSALSAALVFLALKYFHWGLVGVAVAVTVPLLFINLIYLPLLLCQRLEQRLGEFYRQVALSPLLHVLPFALCLLIGRFLYKSHLVLALAVCLIGAVGLAVTYWKSVLPKNLKAGVQRNLKKAGRWVGFANAGSTVG